MAILATVIMMGLCLWKGFFAPREGVDGVLPVPDYVGIAVSAGVTVILLVLALSGISRKQRPMFSPRSAGASALALVVAGGLLIFFNIADLLQWSFSRGQFVTSAYQTAKLASGAVWLSAICGIVGGLGWVVSGCKVFSRNTTEKIAGWESLLPVMWIWFRLACYEMSYASAVGFGTIYFELMAFAFEMVFLFKWARHSAQIGSDSARWLTFWSAGAVLFAFPDTVDFLYDTVSMSSEGTGSVLGWSNLAVGILALTTLWRLAVISMKRGVDEVKPPITEEN